MNGKEAAQQMLVQSLAAQVMGMTQKARRARSAYHAPGLMRDAAIELARAYERAATVFDEALTVARRDEVCAMLDAHPEVAEPLRSMPGSIVMVLDRRIDGWASGDDHLTSEQRELAGYMEELSQQGWQSGWQAGLEFALWEAVMHRRERYGDLVLTETHGRKLRELCDQAGGWLVWDEERAAPVGITLDEWLPRFRSKSGE